MHLAMCYSGTGTAPGRRRTVGPARRSVVERTARLEARARTGRGLVTKAWREIMRGQQKLPMSGLKSALSSRSVPCRSGAGVLAHGVDGDVSV
jgi:hypothetical protein